MDASINSSELQSDLASGRSPLVIDVRKSPAFRAAKETEAIPYDIPDVQFSHEGEFCSFDAFLKHYHLTDPGWMMHKTRGGITAAVVGVIL